LKVVINPSPFIYLGKKRKTGLLRSVFEKIFLPVKVEKEIMKLHDSPEAVQLRDAIREGWVEMEYC